MSLYTIMIYVIDTGYSGNHRIISNGNDNIGHGTAMINFIKMYSPKSDITSIKIENTLTKSVLLRIISELTEKVAKNDIVLLNWVVDKDQMLDNVVLELVNKCNVVCAAGNFGKDIELYSPTTVKGVKVVVCLNKSGNLAKLSNYSNNIPVIGMFGTTMSIDSINGKIICSGTSVSASIYAALLDKYHFKKKYVDKAFNILKNRFANEITA